jgi:lipid II:glycine glycyltransferase (peptidoglycan interpeptide bridge formation enzyme)
MIEIQRCNDKQQWDDYVLEHDGHPLQLWGWGQVKAGHGWSVERIFAYDNDDIVGAAQVLVRRLPSPFKSFAYIPRGPSVSEVYLGEFLKLIAHLVKRDYKAIALSIEPNSREINLPLPWQKSSNRILVPETILLDLEQSESELLGKMAKKTRQYIRKSAADAIHIKRVRTAEDTQACLDLYKETAVRAKFNLHDRQYYLDVQQQLSEHSPIFAAYVNNQPVAFLWLAVSTGTAYELYGGMNDEGQRLRANYALKWHAIRKMKEWGVQEYDFGGLVAGGVSIFKQGWSDPTEFVGTYDFPLSPLYKVWTKALPSAKKIIRSVKRR